MRILNANTPISEWEKYLRGKSTEKLEEMKVLTENNELRNLITKIISERK